MRISDWSSDVCSSDLLAPDQRERHADLRIIAFAFQIIAGDGNPRGVEAEARERAGLGKGQYVGAAVAPNAKHDAGFGAARLPVPIMRVDQRPVGRPFGLHDDRRAAVGPALRKQPPAQRRSEEHTSELQSLMRISYAVFCLKKKKRLNNTKRYDMTL